MTEDPPVATFGLAAPYMEQLASVNGLMSGMLVLINELSEQSKFDEHVDRLVAKIKLCRAEMYGSTRYQRVRERKRANKMRRLLRRGVRMYIVSDPNKVARLACRVIL